jgi:hypothetical protein
MGFDDVDRQFRPKTIKLECVGCGVTNDVEPRTPWYWEWPDHPSPLPLCPECQRMERPPLILAAPRTQPSLF